MKTRCAQVVIWVFVCCLSIARAVSAKDRVADAVEYKSDTATAQQVIIKFLQWYKTNMQKANSFPILVKDSADNFSINKKACRNYLNFLAGSQCLSAKYIAYWQSFFNDKAIGLENNPVKSDIPEGFDLDFVLVTQEPELVLEHIMQVRFKILSERSADKVILLTWPQKQSVQYEFEMHKNNQGWQIDYISTTNFD